MVYKALTFSVFEIFHHLVNKAKKIYVVTTTYSILYKNQGLRIM